MATYAATISPPEFHTHPKKGKKEQKKGKEQNDEYREPHLVISALGITKDDDQYREPHLLFDLNSKKGMTTESLIWWYSCRGIKRTTTTESLIWCSPHCKSGDREHVIVILYICIQYRHRPETPAASSSVKSK